MQYNFDEIIDRRGTDSFKWDFWGDDKSVIPMPVADMDFRCPEPVIEAMRLATEHGIYGYSICSSELVDLVIKQTFEKYNWKIEKYWIVWLPGMVPGITSACHSVGKTDDSIMTTLPVYHPFHKGIDHANRKMISSYLIEKNGRYTLNFDEIERSFDSKTNLFLLCNPYNPGGTVFTEPELRKLSEICLKNNTIVCSDEIHCELILDKTQKHIPYAALSKEAENLSITLLSPSKTYNIAGMGCSFAVIPNAEIRANFVKTKSGMVPELSRHAYLAALSAYRDCGDWYEQLIDYLKINHDYLLEKINAIPGLKMLPHQATYLAWIDCRASPIKNMQELLLKNGVRLIDGSLFKGEGFVRLNFACPFSVLKTAVERIEKAIAEYDQN
ncbi:MAG: PatB family C-S lyase [Bacteroidota bacterium]